VILDEAVSRSDKSVEAQVLNLLQDLKAELGLTYVFISHDLNVVRYMADRVMVMYLGRIAEIGPVEAIYENPRHPYTRALLSAMPSMDPERRTQEAPLAGDPPKPDQPAPRLPLPHPLPFAEEVCAHVSPGLTGSRHRASGRVPHERSRLRSFARDRMSALVTVENPAGPLSQRRRHGARGQRRRLQPEPWRGAGVAGRIGLGQVGDLARADAPLAAQAHRHHRPDPALAGRDVLALDEASARQLSRRRRGDDLQEPMLAFDPVFTVATRSPRR